MFHIGHLNLIKNAKSKCDYLIVGVSTDEVVETNKKKTPIIPFTDRKAIVESIKYVDKVIPQNRYDIEGKIQVVKENNIDVDANATKEVVVNTIMNSNEEKPVRSKAMRRLANRNSEKKNLVRAFTVNPEDRNKPIASEDDITAAEIRMSIKSNLTLTGKISSVTRAELHGQPIYLAIVFYGNYKVSIPAQFLVEMSEEDKTDPDKMKKICENRLGATIDFKVLKEDLDDGIPSAMASRVDAMKIIRRKRWFATEKNGDWKIKEDQIAEGRIISIVQAGIFVEVAGVETFIPTSELDYVRRFDARELYTSNDETVNVYIKSIKRNIETFDVEISASVKDTKTDHKLAIFSAIDDYSLCSGEVRKVIYNKGSDPRVLVWLDQGYPCLCRMTDQIPKQGDSVRVRVKKYEESMKISGIIQHISRPSR